MLWTPQAEFQSIITNFTSRPTSNPGTSLTLGANNTKPGSYTELLSGASLTFDAYGILICISNIAVNATATDALIDIATDPNDGGSYTVKIANLVCGCAGLQNAAGPVFYYFPLFIPAGTQIGAEGQTARASTITCQVQVSLFGDPKHPELVRAGSYVDTFGANTSASAGTAITPGTTSEGSWTDLSGGSDTTKPYWWWEYGFSCTDASMSLAVIWNDLGIGDSSNKKVVISDGIVITDTSERLGKWLTPALGAYDAPAGIRPYGRSQNQVANDAAYTMAAYGVGG